MRVPETSSLNELACVGYHASFAAGRIANMSDADVTEGQ